MELILRTRPIKHKERLEELKIEEGQITVEETKAYLVDKQSARRREAAMVDRTGKKDIILYVLGWTVVIAFSARPNL